MNTHKAPLEDLNVIVSGQGGDGSLTVVNILADVLRNNGLRVYTERDVLSRIKGGITASNLRAYNGERLCISSNIDLLVAFDQLAVSKYAFRLNPKSIVIYDSSVGEITDTSKLPNGVTMIGVPLSRHAVKNFRRDIYKNSISFAVIGRVVGISDDDLRVAFDKRFAPRGKQMLESNLLALDIGFGLADKAGWTPDKSLFELTKVSEQGKYMLMTGNEATALGFAVAGGKFFAGYPITPSTEVMEWLIPWLPKFGGVVKQAEDELSAINMAIGAALTGTRTMTATCGPGIALMQEGIGQLGMGEIPVVIVDVQRSGPSTGMPTKPEQSDMNLLVYGGAGDFPRVVLAPGHPEDCFHISVLATNLCEKYQLPVFIASDQGLGQNSATVAPLDLEKVVIDRGKRLDADQLKEMEVYKRYEFTDDGVSSFAPPGTPGGMSLVTGNEHDEFGLVSVDPTNRIKQVKKREKKLTTMVPELPRAVSYGVETADIGFIGVGMTYGVILEVMDILAESDIHTQFHQVRSIHPMLDETPAFTDRVKNVFVLEYNAGGQLFNIISSNGGNKDHMTSILRYDGVPFNAKQVVEEVREILGLPDKKEVDVA